ncbi:Putative regulatory protein [Streptomyces hygroscopicus subsp. limoneus]|nr:Putative regulatory protein [Streptomyces hygroscopicus subsp. limoneus]
MMPESAGPVTELTSQYVSQVTNDLEHNLKEQERITAEIAVLQEQLATLQHDHGTLLNMQQALGLAAPAGRAVVPAPRKKSGGTRRADDKKPAAAKPVAKKTATKKAVAKRPVAKKAVAKKATAGKPAATKASPSEPAQPTLIELVRRHLAEQTEPRSAAEVSEALIQAYPERGIQRKVVRTTLENLVARNGAQRTKQGTSVFYVVPGESAQETTEGAETGA